ncbi:MAG: LysM peptidoglycan-binding domain-containing protein [Solirubrobacteraceae bacterium]
MRSRILLFTLTAALLAPATASANFAHVVASGETLSSVAAADGLSVDQLATANGLASDSQLTAGATLQIPPQGAAGDNPTATTGPATTASVASAPAGGDYLVQPGDTLSAIAAAHGLSVASLTAANGLDPAAFLISGTTLSISGSVVTATPVADVTTASGSPSTAGAQPTAETVSPSTVGSIAAANGVSPSLAEAIGYQESGFNNALVSATGATGVMQIEPGTWNYIGHNLSTPPPLSPASAQDNIRGGVLLLHSLLGQTVGDPALAAAGYYQGLASVKANGMYSDTQRYVGNVLALRQQFGGP